VDKLTKERRSIVMSKVRSSGNRSTELRVRMALVRKGVSGWVLHPKDVVGKPDFWFPTSRVAVFVDGCFWHGCPRCLRLPSQNRGYWSMKIAANVSRSKRVSSSLRRQQIAVIRIWEHQLTHPECLDRFLSRIEEAMKPCRNVRKVT
jgi:DNA mismatch endonuclease, patch repair protein